MSSSFWKKNLFPITNWLMLFLSIGVFAIGIWMVTTTATTGCRTANSSSDETLISTGSFMVCVSFMGLIYSCYCRHWPRAFMIYKVCMVLAIISVFIGVIFAFALSSKGSGKELPGKAYKEYKLGSYSKLLQSIVKDSQNWNQTKTCMINQSKICATFNNKYGNDTVEKFNRRRLSSVESGCCKPSNDCGFTYQSPTNWSEENGVYEKNPDCKAWDNDPKVLCSNCESCKAGVVDLVKNNLLRAAIANLVFLIAFIALFIIACCAFNKSRDDVVLI